MFKFIRRHWHRRRERFYFNNRWHLVLDIALSVIIILLVALFISLEYYRPDFSNFFNFQFHHQQEINLNNPPLQLKFTIPNSAIEIGKQFAVKIKLKNTSNTTINNIKIDLLSLNNNFSIEKLELLSADSTTKIARGELLISSLKKYEAKTLSVAVYFSSKNNIPGIISWQANSSYLVRGRTIKESSPLTELKTIAKLVVKSGVYYNSPQGDQLGAGPLPPIAYLPTNYWVFWKVDSNGDFNNFVMSARLPLGVELTTSRSLLAGKLNYNSSSRVIVWKIDNLKSKNDNYRAGFEIQLIPTEKQVGQILPLLTHIRYYANDRLSSQEVSGQSNNLTTALTFDRINQGQGKVKQQ